jgi:hypothetical protein
MLARTAMATRADIRVFMIILLDCIAGSSAAHRGDFAARDARVTRSLSTIV